MKVYLVLVNLYHYSSTLCILLDRKGGIIKMLVCTFRKYRIHYSHFNMTEAGLESYQTFNPEVNRLCRSLTHKKPTASVHLYCSKSSSQLS